MKKFLLFMSVGITALVLSAVAVGQMKKALTPYGEPPKVVAEGGMISAKVQKGESSVVGGKYKQSDAALTGLQKARLQKLQEQSAMRRSGKPVVHAPVMKIREMGPAAVADGNARITLDVQMDWGDGTGYQLLLDADHDTYGTAFLYPSTNGEPAMRVDTESYGDFEYKLPSDAKPDGSGDAGGCVMFGEQESIEFPAGTYDFVVGNPDPVRDQVYVAGGDGACGDDYQFNAGTEYLITVTLSADETGDNCTLSVVAPVDLSVEEIVSPSTSTSLGAAEDVTVRVRNRGTDDLQSYRLALTVDGSVVATETVSEMLASGAEKEYTFTAKADLSAAGEHVIKVEASADGDADAANNVAEKSVIHVAPVDAPFTCDFSTADDMALWNVVDANNDGETWVYEETMQSAVLGYSVMYDSDDYLITLNPIRLSAGDAHVAFYYCSLSGYFPERLQVLYGKTADPSEMQLLYEDIDFTISELTFQVVNFNVEEAGDYYFAFYGCSTADQYGIAVDDVEIDEGAYVAAPDISVDKVVVPLSSTALTSGETIGAIVTNNSFADISSFALSYKIGDGAEVKETFGDGLAAGETRTVEFTQKADLSAENTYEITVTASDVVSDLPEENTDDNTAVGTVVHYTPATVPFTVDFSDESQRADYAYDEGSWVYNSVEEAMQADVSNVGQALKSRGVSLEAGKTYRFTFNFCAGYDLFGLLTVGDSFNIVYGIDGTPIEEWEVLESYEDVYTQEVYYDERINVACEQSGVYSFAIVPVSSSGYFFVSGASVTEVMPYDATMVSVDAPTLLPVAQAGKFKVTATVMNNGSSAIESAVVVVKNGEAEVGRASSGQMESGASTDVDVEVNVADAAVGSVVNLEAVVSIEGHESDDSGADNSAGVSIEITEDELGYDYVTDDMYTEENCIGVEGGAIGCGVPFSIAESDVLTGVSIGWGAVVEQNIQIAVYEYDPATLTLGNEIFSEIVPQGTETGQVVYNISPRALEAGDYMVSVTFQDYCLVTNMDVPGMLYLTSGNPVGMQNNLGTPAIRSVFGEGEPVAKDAVVVEISKPSGKGVFSANEPVVVSVKNDGCDEITGTLALSINGENAGSQTITLGGYASSEFTFEADLSKPGEYELEAVATVEGDENPDNNSASKTVISEEAADPYTMDFEQCEDFATSGFNPAWKTVDADGDQIYGFKNISFPIPADGKAAYIVFNPSMTVPALDDDVWIQPHGGDRFAACFAASGNVSGAAVNNDWLISPKLTLPTADAQMTFFVKSYTGEYGLEKYNVLVSETDDNLESFEMIGTTREAPYEEWQEVTVDLSDYAGKDVYLAIQCVSEDAFIFMLDDITVSKPVGSVAENAVATLSLYPNPASDVVVIASGGSSIEKVEIFNASGSAVYSSRVADSNSFRYNVSALDAGVYLAKVATSDGTKVMRFIVK